MGFLAKVKDFLDSLAEDNETPIYTPSEGLEKRVYGIISKYGFWHDGNIHPLDTLDNLWYDKDLLDHVALQNDIDREFGIDLPPTLRVVGEIYDYIKSELDKREPPVTASQH